MPGDGGNWGGSFLAVPKQSKHQEAIELAKFLTSPQGQIGAFKAEGNLPSSPTLDDDPAMPGDERVLQRRPDRPDLRRRRQELKPVYLGAKNQAVRDAVENALRSGRAGQAVARRGLGPRPSRTPRTAAG